MLHGHATQGRYCVTLQQNPSKEKDMTEFWTLLAGIAIGIIVLMVGIIIDRDEDQTVGDALAEGTRWGAWFMVVFGSQAAVISGM
jgi:hypothetical protein